MSTFAPISLSESENPVQTVDTWIDKYKEAFVEQVQDTSQLILIHPDDCLLVAGPPRLHQAGDNEVFFPLGFCSAFSYNNPRQVAPVKALGSRRNFFSCTGAPVSGSLDRLLFVGRNFLNALYANATVGSDITSRNSKYVIGDGDNAWFTNMEEDLFRIPFGLGVIYNSPSTLAGIKSKKTAGGAEYFECCTLSGRSVSLQAGGPTVAEHVDFQADRVVPWVTFPSVKQTSIFPVIDTSGIDGTESPASSSSSSS